MRARLLFFVPVYAPTDVPRCRPRERGQGIRAKNYSSPQVYACLIISDHFGRSGLRRKIHTTARALPSADNSMRSGSAASTCESSFHTPQAVKASCVGLTRLSPSLRRLLAYVNSRIMPKRPSFDQLRGRLIFHAHPTPSINARYSFVRTFRAPIW